MHHLIVLTQHAEMKEKEIKLEIKERLTIKTHLVEKKIP